MDEQPRLIRLDPQRVASAHAFGPAPELEAWSKLKNWAQRKGLDVPGQHRIFGFNNPDPSPGSPNYGYEFWITVGQEIVLDGEVEIKDFPGGLYAVARCEVRGDPEAAIPAAWQRLVLWREASPYKPGTHQWLEEHLSAPDSADAMWDMDLYMPIME